MKNTAFSYSIIASLFLFSCGAQKQMSDKGFTSLFNGKNLDGWVGNKQSYSAENGMIVIKPDGGGNGGNLFTEG